MTTTIHESHLAVSSANSYLSEESLQDHGTRAPSVPEYEDVRNVPQLSITSGNNKASLDFTQRIERKLAEYNASENVLKRWFFEIISWLISALCMVAIIFIYIIIRGRPISDYGSFLTWTNVLGKVSSAALIVPTSEALGQLKWNWFHSSKAMWDFEIFDKASRGPWGALMLLFRTKGRSLAALGALLIVLLLAIDTFFQQVVNTPDRWRLESRAPLVPRAIFYSPGNPMEYQGGDERAGNDRDIFLVVSKFSYGNGTQPIVFGNGTRPDIPISCPTSNCTWPSYDTLGVCSQCTDISSYLTFACLTHTVDWKAGLYGLFDLQEPYPNMTACGYFLNATSNNPILLSGYLLDPVESSAGEALIMRTLPLTTLTRREPLYGNGSMLFKHLRHTIADVFIASANNGSVEAVYRNETPVAQECVLSWCVKKMQSSYYLGEYNEEVIATTFNTTSGPFPWISLPYETEMENGTDIFYRENISIRVDASTNEHNNPEFGTSNQSASAIIQSFPDIFPAFTTVMNKSAAPIFRYKTYRTGVPWTQQPDFNPWLAPNNVTSHMERLATGMTNVLRSASSRHDFSGHAFSIETYISVHWGWLAYPMGLLVLSLIFLVCTIIRTSKDTSTGIWKTSAMPTLIYSLPKETQSQFTTSSTWSSTEGKKKVRIRLLPNMGWRVSGQSQASFSPKLPPTIRPPRGWI